MDFIQSHYLTIIIILFAIILFFLYTTHETQKNMNDELFLDRTSDPVVRSNLQPNSSSEHDNWKYALVHGIKNTQIQKPKHNYLQLEPFLNRDNDSDEEI